MLAHIQRGAKHDTLTQYRDNVGSAWANNSPALGQCLVLAGAASDCTLETAGKFPHQRGHTEQTEVSQYVPHCLQAGGGGGGGGGRHN